jgi:hypothetical protein
MRGAKPWQIVLVVAAVVAVCASLAWTLLGGGDNVNMADEFVLVDVSTGELFSVPNSGNKAVVIPATNPATGRAMLVPVSHRDGKWFVGKKYLAGLEQPAEKLAALVDRDTGEVSVKSEKPKRLR